ncbi:hypothetical protein LTS08_003265 [Lithohypha guttulata]|uniref:uracil phosphoribosyltransferase n=1 Tax=Lithohypha guttulata TaxID=1690604 RepID=A0AAN7Y600_9EURO|nr:hypothetical protein LTR51_000079 [Lithohypha guttulata]KAK5085274.1 hypothetical protein LTR05_004555 [Lithohypha guttulata]KAK5103843.1 hypothetical protein LTS08_003265 [Lithohypha guttulata]
MSDLPPNVHVSRHPCLRAKLSQLRSKSTTSRETQRLVHDISLILGTEALANIELVEEGTDETPLGFPYTPTTIPTQTLTLVPILRSGLSMVDAIQSLLPTPISVHHLGLYREKSTLQPVEYYNNLPQSQSQSDPPLVRTAILVDPVIATGGTAIAAIQTLREWGVQRVIVVIVMGAVEGVRRAAEEWSDATEFWVGAVDGELTEKGMIKPGLGDIGDRLFGTIGK